MNRFFCWICLAASVFALLPEPAAAQQAAAPTPILDAMEAGIRNDPRVQELKSMDPAALVSEAGYAVTWPPLRERDIYWKSRITRTIEFRDDHNGRLIATPDGRIDLYKLLAAGLLQGRIAAYGPKDDRLIEKLTVDAVRKLLAPSDENDDAFESVSKFMIRQDWIYIGPEKKLVSRIIAIAPLRESVVADGVIIKEPIFWLYYPSIRPLFRETHVPGTDGSGPNLDEIFENWSFRSPIISAKQTDQMTTLDFLSRENRERVLGKD